MRVIQPLELFDSRQARWHNAPIAVISLPLLLAACWKRDILNSITVSPTGSRDLAESGPSTESSPPTGSRSLSETGPPTETESPAESGAKVPSDIDHRISVLYANEAQAPNEILYHARASFDDAAEPVTWQIKSNEAGLFLINNANNNANNNAGQISINADIADGMLEAGTKTYFATAIAQSGDQTEEIVLAFTLIIDDLTIEDIASAQVFRGTTKRADTHKITPDTDFIIGFEGDDWIELPPDSSSQETVIYRIDSSNKNWRGPDRGDAIDNFELGVDQLVLIDLNDEGIQNFSEFISSMSDASSILHVIFFAKNNAYQGLLLIFEHYLQTKLAIYFDEPIAFDDNDKGTEIYALHDNGTSGLKRSDYGTALEVLFDDGSLLVTTDQTPYGLELV